MSGSLALRIAGFGAGALLLAASLSALSALDERLQPLPAPIRGAGR